MSAPPFDPWRRLVDFTPARIGLGRAGVSPPTREILSFALAHARARDAVHARLEVEALRAALTGLGLESVPVESEARDRAVYLRRPDLGRVLAESSRARLAAAGRAPCDLALAIGDGLSATAVMAHSVATIAALLPFSARRGWTFGPAVVAEGARVALGDPIGEALGARAVVMLIGERPGLSASDSLGIYLTFDPRPGRLDSERNCISNVRPEGLPPALAAAKLAWLIDAALTRGFTGVGLKDESDPALEFSASREIGG